LLQLALDQINEDVLPRPEDDRLALVALYGPQNRCQTVVHQPQNPAKTLRIVAVKAAISLTLTGCKFLAPWCDVGVDISSKYSPGNAWNSLLNRLDKQNAHIFESGNN
jgi:hypothetical protein